MWRSWLTRQFVALEIVGSSPIFHPIKLYYVVVVLIVITNESYNKKQNIGLQPSGKAVDFDSTMRQFESSQPSQIKKKLQRSYGFFFDLLGRSVSRNSGPKATRRPSEVRKCPWGIRIQPAQPKTKLQQSYNFYFGVEELVS